MDIDSVSGAVWAHTSEASSAALLRLCAIATSTVQRTEQQPMGMHWEESDAWICFDKMAIPESTPLDFIADPGCIRSCKFGSSTSLAAQI